MLYYAVYCILHILVIHCILMLETAINMMRQTMPDASVFFLLRSHRNIPDIHPAFCVLTKQRKLKIWKWSYWKVLKGTESWGVCLLSINSTNGVNRQCVPSSDSSIWGTILLTSKLMILLLLATIWVFWVCDVSCVVASFFSPDSSVRTVYVLILPFALIELGHLMPVAVTVTAWALLSIEDGQLLDMSETIAFVQSTSRLQDQPAIQVVDVLAQTGSDTVHRSQMMVS